MSSNWQGFTDAELNKIINGNQKPKIVKPVARKVGLQKNKSSNHKPIKKKMAIIPTVEAKKEISPKEKVQAEKDVENEVKHEEVQNPVKVQDVDVITDEKLIQEKDIKKLENIHKRQKEMEEKNRRKKEMLSQEIAVRKKRALAESSKLKKVQTELAKLDQLLSFDVSILRDKIDEACIEFNNAKKRFQNAENEYIESKIQLHQKTVMKEDLTEHLYHLIEANEERKSKKLEELMLALDVEENDLPEVSEDKVEKNEEKIEPEESSKIKADIKLEKKDVKVDVTNGKTPTENLHGADTKSEKG